MNIPISPGFVFESGTFGFFRVIYRQISAGLAEGGKGFDILWGYASNRKANSHKDFNIRYLCEGL